MFNASVRYAHIRKASRVDGPGGPRTVLWLQGCSIRCEGCQNTVLWNPDNWDFRQAAEDLALKLRTVAGDNPITITGGEPFDQAPGLMGLLLHIRMQDYNSYPKEDRRHIILYTGYTWSQLIARMAAEGIGSPVFQILIQTDVLVDSPYIQHLDHDYIQWRGSTNQNPIDVAASFGIEEPVLLDWDVQEIQIDGTAAIMTGGLATELGLAAADVLERCGEHVGPSPQQMQTQRRATDRVHKGAR